jgi:hypothetical protein
MLSIMRGVSLAPVVVPTTLLARYTYHLSTTLFEAKRNIKHHAGLEALTENNQK